VTMGVLQQKSAVGKTIAVNFAAALARDGKRILLIDADPQGSALAWSAAREAPPLFRVVGLPKPTLHRDVPELAKDYDVVVIDGAPPRTTDTARSAVMASDFISRAALTPRRLGGCRHGAAHQRGRRRDVGEALAQYGVPVLPAALSQRVLFAETFARGLTVSEVALCGDAGRELTRLVEAVLDSIQQQKAAA
jgi:chromosome partitioning protein